MTTGAVALTRRARGAGAALSRHCTATRIVSGAALLFLVPVCLRLPWRGDIGHHAATVERLRADLLHPSNPLLSVPGGSPYYSPYTVGAALLAKATRLTGLQVLPLCAIVNVVLLVTGLTAFVRTLSTRRWAPGFALLALLALWGHQVFVWGGFFSLVSLSLAVCYPSLFALGLTLHLWALVGRATGRGPLAGRRPGPPGHAAIGLLAALILISHPVTGVAAVFGVVALVLGRARSQLAPAWPLCALSVGVALSAIAAWPYYNVLTLAGAADLDSFHDRLYAGASAKYGLLLIGLPALAARVRRDRFDPLVWLFVLCGAGVAYGWFSRHYTWGRLLPIAALAVQCALAIELAAARPWRWPRRVLATATAGAMGLGLWTQSGALLYLVPAKVLPSVVVAHMQRRPPWPRYDWVSGHVRYGDVVLTSAYLPTHMVTAYGVYTVAPGYPTPPVTRDEGHKRWVATWTALSMTTAPTTRAGILHRYHVSWLLLAHWQRTPPEDRFTSYRVVARSRTGERLIRVISR